jgi:tape measure domain-containing protein
MSMSEIVAEYVSVLKVKTDPQSISKLQRNLDDIEKRVRRTFSRLEKQDLLMNALFKINVPKLTQQLNRSLNEASNKTVFTIKNFRVDQGALDQAIQHAASRARTVTINPRVNNVRGGGSGDRSSASRGLISGSSRSPGVMWHSALAGGGILSGFGLRALNNSMRQLQSMPVAMEAVTGSKERAAAELAYLNNLGNEVGAPMRTLAPEYTKFLASAMGTPLEGTAQSSYRSVLRYSKVIGMDDQAVKGTLKALTQIANKQKIYSEELVGQLGERAPAAIRMMADAMTNGDTKKLFELMEKGALDPNEAIPRFAAEMEERAAVGWNALTQTQGYQQDIATKRAEDLLKVFSANGGESGFFRIWKSIADMLPEITNLIKGLGGAFDTFSVGLEKATKIFVMFDDLMENFYKASPQTQSALTTLGLAFAAFGTKVGRSLIPFTTLFLILDDLATYNRGGESVIGDILGSNSNYSSTPEGLKKPGAGFRKSPIERSGIFNGMTATEFMKSPYAFSSPSQLPLWLLSLPTAALESLGSGLGNVIPTFSNPAVLTPSAQIDAIANQMAWGGKVPDMLSPQNGKSGNTYHITVETKSDDPYEHGALIMRTMQNMSTGE